MRAKVPACYEQLRSCLSGGPCSCHVGSRTLHAPISHTARNSCQGSSVHVCPSSLLFSLVSPSVLPGAAVAPGSHDSLPMLAEQQQLAIAAHQGGQNVIPNAGLGLWGQACLSHAVAAPYCNWRTFGVQSNNAPDRRSVQVQTNWKKSTQPVA